MKMRPASCERAAEFVSLALDGELSPFERAMLRRHVEHCAPCAEYSRVTVRLTELLRATPVEMIRLPILDVRSPRRFGPVMRGVAATAAAAAMAVWLGVSPSGSPREIEPVTTPRSQPAPATSDSRDWSAGLPRTTQVVQLVPGGLYSFEIAP
jgi:ferric-dicitrate binding protein FerR (iron transport regulator)